MSSGFCITLQMILEEFHVKVHVKTFSVHLPVVFLKRGSKTAQRTELSLSPLG